MFTTNDLIDLIVLYLQYVCIYSVSSKGWWFLDDYYDVATKKSWGNTKQHLYWRRNILYYCIFTFNSCSSISRQLSHPYHLMWLIACGMSWCAAWRLQEHSHRTTTNTASNEVYLKCNNIKTFQFNLNVLLNLHRVKQFKALPWCCLRVTVL